MISTESRMNAYFKESVANLTDIIKVIDIPQTKIKIV